MPACGLDISGQIAVQDGCGNSSQSCGGSGSPQKLQPLSLSCTGRTYQSVVSTDCPMTVSSPAAFISVPLLEQIAGIEFLFVQTNSPLTLRLNGLAASLLGVGATFPTSFSGGETLISEVDGAVAVTTTFLVGDQTAAQVAARINAAYALAGQPLPASVGADGQVLLSGVQTGAEGSIDVTGGTANTALGFAFGTNSSAVGSAQDVTINGLWMAEFGSNDAVARVQMRGVASQVMILAAGTAP